MKWILILSLFSDGYHSGAASAAFGGEFSSRAACIAAGDAWLKQMHAAYRNNATQGLNITPKALCVRSSQ